MARDRRNLEQLANEGWRIYVVWECQIDGDEEIIEELIAFLGPPRTAADVLKDASETALAR